MDYKRLQEVTRGTRGYMGLKEITEGYKGLQKVTRDYKRLQEVKRA